MRIGIDLGGTKIEAVVLDTRGREVARKRVPTPAGDYQATVKAVIALVREMEKHAGTSSTVGIGTPGSAAPRTGVMRNANSTALNGQVLESDLIAELGRRVRIANDANCLALSEAIDGVASRTRVVFAIILGTGVGAGIVVNRKVVTGRNNVAGEWGHNQLPWMRHDEQPGLLCFCGKHGCIETFLSGPAFAREFAETTGLNFSAEEIAIAARSGDSRADEALSVYEDRLARGLAHVVNVLDPDVIVAGGGVSNIARLYESVPKLLPKYTISRDVVTPFVPARHGDASGVRGAAWLWP